MADHPVPCSRHFQFALRRDTREVELVALAGTREVYGLNNKVDGKLDAKPKALTTKARRHKG